MKRILPVLLGVLLMTPTAFAWDQAGHKLIAHIAYRHLTVKARVNVDRLTQENMGQDFPPLQRFVFISTWADWERARGNNSYDTWHYIDLPYADTGFRPKAIDGQNVVFGIERCVATLRQPLRPIEEHRTALKLLVHLVGDIHQPLHAVNRYNAQHPNGDHGGNAYHIHSKTANNLHAYWDMGLGEFRRFQSSGPETQTALQKYAASIEERLPASSFVPARLKTLPIEWANEGHDLALIFAYELKENDTPSRSYHYQGKQIMEQRIAIAGYRLATLLNQIYS